MYVYFLPCVFPSLNILYVFRFRFLSDDMSSARDRISAATEHGHMDISSMSLDVSTYSLCIHILFTLQNNSGDNGEI